MKISAKKPQNPIKELIKPLDIQSEEQFFEVKSLCEEYGKGDDCFSGNKSIDAEDDLLF